ncbi:peptidase M23 [Luteimonas aestuarii]|uniref:Peptidase M23 n=2 Tax=Luteimonas aestuarii TaxID=453837 RepID=A0A4R5TRK3_9GAMM|nr:peptidase M23 [Luteimonas aestuarii]
MAWASALLLAAGLMAAPGAQSQQNSRDAERRLENVRKELREVASERRRLEGQRGEAARALRQSDEQVAASARELRDVEARIAQEQAALSELQARRAEAETTMAAQREELRALLRASYAVGDAAPLKLLLSQDSAADAGRTLAYHGYLQRHRGERIATLRAELTALADMEREIGERTAALEASRSEQRTRLATLERDRRERNAAVADLDKRYRDRGAREQALGRDAKSLEQLLARLRAAAARAEAERRAAANRQAQPRTPARAPARNAPARPAVASAAPAQVGGLGWPLSGSLLANYGARLPDGRSSNGILIGAPTGTQVRAVADGTVVFAEWMTGYGMFLIIDHGNGHMSLYGHNEALLKKPGDRVARGDAVATVGNSGGQGRPGLYFELRRNGQPVNPNTWLQRR